MTATFVANEMYSEVVEKVGMSSFQIMLAIQNRFGYEISYDMAWRAKHLALENMPRIRTHIIMCHLF